MLKKMNSFSKDVISKIDNLDQSRPVFGIDLGTTNSAISVITKGNQPVTIRLADGNFTMPSCVMWKDGEFIVGREAYVKREFANVVYSVKRHMQTVGKTVTFRDGSKTLEMTPTEVSAKILQGLVEQAGDLYGEIKDVIVTVPAYFDQNGRNATREACELAGLNLLDILNEPTAAALCYDIADAGTTEYITFDFGGGTFDVTLARIINNSSNDEVMNIYGITNENERSEGKTIECIAIEGNSHLGGDDIDRDMYEILCRKLKQKGIDASKFTREYRENLILRLEGFKKHDSMVGWQMEIDTDLIGGGHVTDQVMLVPEDFEAAVIPSYTECKKILDKLLKNNPNSARKIILVGGSTKNPHLVNMLKRNYPEFEISDALDKDLAVSQGAAIKGKITKFGSDEIKVFDILPISIGILDEDHVTPLAVAGSTLPVMASHSFTTVVDNQTAMRLQVMQGNSANPDKCVSLGTILFDNIPLAKAGGVNLGVSITVSATSQMTCRGIIHKSDGTDDVRKLVLDLTGETAAPTLSKEEQLIKRWTKRLGSVKSEEDRAMLQKLIDGFPSIVSKNDVMSFIKELNKKEGVGKSSN